MDSQNENEAIVEVRLTGFTSIHFEELSIHWLVKDQDYVEMGDPICDVESGKATVTFEAPEDGIITIVKVEDIRVADDPYSILATIETPEDALFIR